MRAFEAGALAGLIGGTAMAVVMQMGRRAGLLEKTLAEESEDWLDRNFYTRAAIGGRGTSALELGNPPGRQCRFRRDTRSWRGWPTGRALMCSTSWSGAAAREHAGRAECAGAAHRPAARHVYRLRRGHGAGLRGASRRHHREAAPPAG